MKDNAGTQRAQLRGHMFEVAIMRLLQANGFVRTAPDNARRIRERRRAFVEFRGRGAWHQIDCPCDYRDIIPFTYPIRLLGEVKFHKKPIEKRYIREFIGVVKDIQENYFVPGKNRVRPNRTSDIGAVFSASGFDPEAEDLAFAHCIKTISYSNDPNIEPIKGAIEILERQYLDTQQCMPRLGDFLAAFDQCLNGDPQSLLTFVHPDTTDEALLPILESLRVAASSIECSFVAMTSGGALLHFTSRSPFPEHLFRETDERTCMVMYTHRERQAPVFYLTIAADPEQTRFHFSPPLGLRNAVFASRLQVIDEKERLMKTLHVALRIGGIKRNLVLRLNTDWLRAARARA